MFARKTLQETMPLGDITNASAALQPSIAEFLKPGSVMNSSLEEHQDAVVQMTADMTTGASSEGFLPSQGEELVTLAKDLAFYGDQYALSSTCMMFLDRVLSEKKAAHSTSDLNVMESAAQSHFLDGVDAFERETKDYEAALQELEEAKKCVQDHEDILQNANFIMASGRDIQSELNQSEDVLIKLQEQQYKVDENLATIRLKNDQAQVSLELTVDEVTSSNSTSLSGKFNMKNSVEEKEFANAMKKIQDQRDNADALLEGLRVLTGIQSVNVPKEMIRLHSNRLSSSTFNAAKSVKDEHVLPMKVEIGDLNVVLTLNDKLRLLSIEVIQGELELDGDGFNQKKRRSLVTNTHMPVNNSTSDVLSQIMEEANVFSAPQDLRYAIFALGCIQKSPVILRAHVSELRKKCIVRSTGPLSAEFTLSAGVTVSLIVHKCYPNAPSGVTTDSIVGVGGWTVAEIEVVKKMANSQSISTIMEMFEFLQSSECFGE